MGLKCIFDRSNPTSVRVWRLVPHGTRKVSERSPSLRCIPFVLIACLQALAATPLVAVMPLETNDVTPGEAQLLGDAIGTKLQETGSFRVMERSQMEKILSEQGFQQSGACNGTECAVQMGQVLGIDRMVVGSVGRLGTAWVLNLRMVSVGTGEVVASSSRNQKGEIADLLTELAPQAVSDLTARSSASETTAAGSAKSADGQKSSSAWVWWTLGGLAVVGGGAAAAVVLLADDGGSSAGSGDGASNTTSAGSFEVKWGN